MKNPLFIPKGFEEIKEDGSRILYQIKEDGSKILYHEELIQGKNLRLIEYYDKKGLLKRVNVWGICGEVKVTKNYIIVTDENIDFKTSKELRKDIEPLYPKNLEIIFF